MPADLNPALLQNKVLKCTFCNRTTRLLHFTYVNPPKPPSPPPPANPDTADDDDITPVPPHIAKERNARNIKKYPCLSQLAYLEYTDETGATKTAPLPDHKTIISVGRISALKPSDIKLLTRDSSMSRQHFIIEVDAKSEYYKFTLKNYPDSAGTFILNAYDKWIEVSDQFVPILTHGSVIGAGETKVVFKLRPLD